MGSSVAYDGFDYTSGTLIHGQNGGTGAWSTPWGEDAPIFGDSINDTVNSSSLTFTNGQTLVVNGGSLSVTGITSDDYRNFTSPATTLYFSFLMQKTSTGTSGGTSDYGGLSIGGNKGGVSGLFVGLPGGSNTVSVEQTNVGGTVTSSTQLALNDVAFLVAKLTLNTTLNAADSLQLFVNPVPGSSEGSNAFIEKNDLDIGTAATAVELLSGTSSNWRFDEVRIGTTFEDVTPAVVPEPASLGLLGAGALALLLRRHRRR